MISNYRPIILTSVVSKVLERLIHHKLHPLLEHHLISHAQFGFCKKRSTTHLLLSAVDDWARTLNDCNSAHCLFLDFDTVPHQCMLLKLEHYDITDSLLKWFSAFLTQRTEAASCC